MPYRWDGSTLFVCLLIALFGLLVIAAPVQAVPAAPEDITLTQPDGTEFTARQWGSELRHGFETIDGYTIEKASNNYWYFVMCDKTRGLIEVWEDGHQLIVGKDAPPSQSYHARPYCPNGDPSSQGTSQNLENQAGEPPLARFNGAQRLLLVVVNFSDRVRTYPLSYFKDLAFGETNSLREYYREASSSNLFLTPAVESYGTPNDGIIEIVLPYPHPNISTNYSLYEAFIAVNPYINFAFYDQNGDKIITNAELQIVFVIAGYEQSTTNKTPYIWAHYSSENLYLDGVGVGHNGWYGEYGGFSVIGEIQVHNGVDHPATLGVLAHELGHNLTWPELADNDGSSSGVGDWSVMGSGSWNGLTYPGDTPALPDAWLKWSQAWLFPTEAKDGTAYNLGKADSSPDALLLGSNPGGVDWDSQKHSGTGEYFLVENRQKSGYDAALPGCGILIWHIDETRSSNTFANADENHPLVSLEQADGANGLRDPSNQGDSGDPYPGSGSSTLFNDTSLPDSRFYDGTSSSHTLEVNTTSCGAAMTVTYTGPGAPVPTGYAMYLPATWHEKLFQGHVTYMGAPVSGQLLEMLYTTDNWNTYTRPREVLTDANGNYTFSIKPELGDGKSFVVRWINPDNKYRHPKLTAWVCEEVIGVWTDKYTCDFDIQDVVLKKPDHDARVNLPETFSWYQRTTTSDDYEVDWWNTSLDHYMWTKKLHYASSFTLQSIPSVFQLKTPYTWTVYVYGANGYGVPYWARWVLFLDHGVSPLQGTVPTSDLFSKGEWTHLQPVRFLPEGAEPKPRLEKEYKQRR